MFVKRLKKALMEVLVDGEIKVVEIMKEINANV